MTRRLSRASLLVTCLTIGCGGKVVVDGAGGSATDGASHTSTSGVAPAACPFGPTDQEIHELEGTACGTADEICASNNGCGGCSITCVGGIWISTNEDLCFFVGDTC